MFFVGVTVTVVVAHVADAFNIHRKWYANTFRDLKQKTECFGTLDERGTQTHTRTHTDAKLRIEIVTNIDSTFRSEKNARTYSASR